MTSPAGTVTIMFTDLVGSTALGDRLGEETAQALRRAHDRILRREFEPFGGSVVKGTGDGFMVSFASARQGVECAVQVQRAIAGQQAEGRYLELQVRIGLHTGEPVAEGGDLFGSDVNLAARIQVEAEGGQVFVSEVTRLLARDNPGLQFLDRGERSLKGFAEPQRLFEVRWPDERAGRPTLTRFVGRQEEAAQLRQQLEAAVRGQGGLVLVAGEPGVGKTRLLSELAIYAADRGLQVLTGRAYETEGMPPYLPFTEPLSQYLRTRTADELREDLDGSAAYLAKLLPRLHQLIPDLPEPPPLSPEAERYRLFEAVTEVLLTIATRQPLLLFLDDLHWADAASLLLLRHFAPRLPQAPLLAVGAYRDVEVTEQHPLAGLLSELSRQRVGASIALRPFGLQDAAALVEALLGQPPAPRVLDALFAASEGNPFFTEELVRHLQEQGRDLADPEAPVGDWAIPEGVRQVIAKRLARLGKEANRVLAHSSVLGREISLPKVAAVTGRDEDSLLDLLEEALAAHLLREEGQYFAFAHPLIQETLYQGLSAPRRRQLHLRAAEALEVLYSADLEPAHLAELAHHFCQAGSSGDADKAIGYAVRAAERALSQVAYEEAARLYQMALQALDLKRKADVAERCELLLALGDAQIRTADKAGARQTFRQAADIARNLGEPERLAHAALGLGGRGARRFELGEVDELLIGLLQEALGTLKEGESVLRSTLLTGLAFATEFSEPPERRLALSQEAVDIARRVGDPDALGMALGVRHNNQRGMENVEDRLADATEMVRLSEEAGNREGAYWSHFSCLIDLLQLGDIAGVDHQIEACTRLAGELRLPTFLCQTKIMSATRAMLDGRFQDAERLAQEALAEGQRAQIGDAAAQFAVQILGLRREQGRLGELQPIYESLTTQPSTHPGFRGALAWIYSELGREAETRRHFDLAAENAFAGLPRDAARLTQMAILAETCSFLGDVERAAELYAVLLPSARLNVALNEAICLGPASRYLGLLAAITSRWEEAEQHFERALEMNARMGARPWVAWTQHDYGRMLLARGRAADRRKALELLEAAMETARELAMKALLERAQALKSEAQRKRHTRVAWSPPAGGHEIIGDG
ncbi:MAG: AAA family ATPase [Chloroflexi bacterium]|nr:AAA family ATPase [Chloroflexota bacterium]